MANRTPTQPSAEFEELCDQRDELAVRLSLLMDEQRGNTAEIQALRNQIFDLDKKIRVAWKGVVP